jgi:CheY-like chemotaxis protein
VPDVTVLVDDDHRDAIEAIAAALERAGLRVGQVLPAIGAITGSIEDAAVLAAVEGVEAIEPAREVRLPPPDADVQ